MAMLASDFRNFDCGPRWGRKTGCSSGVLALAGSTALPGSAAAGAVVGELVSGSNRRRLAGIWRSRGMAGPPVTLGHDLGPKGDAERFAARHRLARLAIPPGAGQGVGVGERGGEDLVVLRPGVEIS